MKKRHSSISSLSLPPQRFVMLLDSSLLSASFHGRKDTGKCRICQQCQDSLRKVHSFRICEGSVVCYCFMDARRKHKIQILQPNVTPCLRVVWLDPFPQVSPGNHKSNGETDESEQNHKPLLLSFPTAPPGVSVQGIPAPVFQGSGEEAQDCGTQTAVV